jgi:lipid-A-disaccharide synthase
MQAEGLVSDLDIKEIAVGGLVEVIPHVLRIEGIIRRTAADIARRKPDVLLTIDSPGFCFRVAGIVRKFAPETRLIHLVAPSVWAWRPGRAKKLSQLYDKLLTLFDFEPQYFTKHGLDTEFVGHPLVEVCRPHASSRDDIVLLMPGSRVSEIRNMLSIFVEASGGLGGRIVIPTISYLEPLVMDLTRSTGIEVVSQEAAKMDLYGRARLAIVASGTATLQLALFGCPMVVCYRMNSVTFSILKRLVRTRFISLVNIIMNDMVVPELIQDMCKRDEIGKALANLDAASQTAAFEALRSRLMRGGEPPSERIASALLDCPTARL